MQNQDRPLLSIVTVCYNSAKTIERTFKSILDQQYFNYEYIVVDGGSKDGTVELIKNYEPLFNGRMKWKSEPDKGIYDAFNKGIDRSCGKYVWIVNSDDYLQPNAIHELEKIITKKNNPDIISGVVRFVRNNEVIKRWSYSAESSEREFRKKRLGVAHPATIVKKSAYDRWGKYDPDFYIAGDLDWFLTMKQNGAVIVFPQIELTNWSDGGISTKKQHKRLYHDWKRIYKKHTKSQVEYISFLIYRVITYIKNGV
ncbi:glycosyltransferase family 2 protein [Bacteroides acidifaciens]|jgi:glycosyltransferase involved in cell wall biosynthesis|uniref:glycosyltransferase family 2 protein n=1 Tax=Bacteroides acidifaciens TaxID=85831 RepID=UPI0025701C30|nr:glycosyltransferase family 2 protein [Bacteroides acidifaciens]